MSAEVVTLGETMALFSNEGIGKLMHSAQMNLGIGGAESNFAIGLSRLGVQTAWIGRVGDDPLGELVLREIRAEGVRAVGIVDPDAPTGLMVKERRTLGSSNVSYYRARSAGSRLCPDDVPAHIIQRARLLHLTGITPALSTSAANAVTHAIDVARAAGVVVSFDLNYRSKLWDATRATTAFLNILPKVDLVFAGLDEAKLISARPDRPTEDLAAELAEYGPSRVIIKDGERGATSYSRDRFLVQDAVPVAVLDTVGAGDAFAAGYISSYLANEAPEASLLQGVRAGAFACLSSGDWEGLPSRRDLELFDSARDPVRR